MILRLARLIATAQKANNIPFPSRLSSSSVLGSNPGGPSPVSSLLCGGHDEGLVVLVVLEVDLVHRPRHDDGDVVVPSLQHEGTDIDLQKKKVA